MSGLDYSSATLKLWGSEIHMIKIFYRLAERNMYNFALCLANSSSSRNGGCYNNNSNYYY